MLDKEERDLLMTINANVKNMGNSHNDLTRTVKENHNKLTEQVGENREKVTGEIQKLTGDMWNQFRISDKRFRVLENWRSWMAGGIAVLGLVIAIVLKVFL